MKKYVRHEATEVSRCGPILVREISFSSSWAKRKSEMLSQREGARPKIRLVANPEMVK